MAASRRHPGVLWVHNDGSDERLFALNTNGQVVAAFKLQDKVADLEDIAIGPGPDPGVPYLYLGDIGDNETTRRSIRVYRFPEPELTPSISAKRVEPIARFETIKLRYPDGAHDAETLMVDPLSGEILIVTKEKRKARVYVAAENRLADKADIGLTLMNEVAFAEASAGDISPDGREIILRRENAAVVWSREPGETVAVALARRPKPARIIGPPREPNGESVAWSPDGKGYYTLSEGARQAIYFFSP
ncbi:MAG: hypothetical protein HY735_24580 [Verrucomicrobia bacterium]|nr:hypothetical protein [Verrucomicrobiota bacterium]